MAASEAAARPRREAAGAAEVALSWVRNGVHLWCLRPEAGGSLVSLGGNYYLLLSIQC